MPASAERFCNVAVESADRRTGLPYCAGSLSRRSYACRRRLAVRRSDVLKKFQGLTLRYP